MSKKLTLLFCVISILFSNNMLKLPLSHQGIDSRPAEYERGIFLIVLASQSLENWLGDQSNGEDFSREFWPSWLFELSEKYDSGNSNVGN